MADEEKKDRESSRLVFDEGDNDNKNGKQKGKDQISRKNGGRALVLDELMREQEKAQERNNMKDYWLWKGIIVRIMSKALAKKGYYKQNGVVLKVIDKYVYEIKMLESKHLLRVNQEELKTVILRIRGLMKLNF
ncbi:unnamed protein product [Fraxinus pennsylvanica]|uniref:KN17 SH3-like domain-containing protein n=1 Tax=Fraxinus pennsylvanica TaxID=56036 RepID=A0AAD1Z4J3_9LAMI|nr:unnamed protein product [Fraxinus pennsylvanica]